MWRDAALVAGKDLRIELRSRVLLNQVAPFGLITLVLFAFALGPDPKAMRAAAPGLFWVAVLFAGVLAVQRSFAIETTTDGTSDGLRLSGLDPAGVFLGKAAAVTAQLFVLEAVIGAGVVVLFGAHVTSALQLVAACAAGTAGFAAAGVLYGSLASGLRSRSSLLPLLLLPVSAPVLLAGAKVWQSALGQAAGSSARWLPLLIVFTVVYVALGVAVFGTLHEADG